MKINIFMAFMLVSASLKAAVGCMDDSKHTDTCDGCDYKNLEYVHCNCPCEKYGYSARFGQCCKCGHYRTPKEVTYLR